MTPFGHNVPGSYDSTDITGSVLLNQGFSTGGDSAPPARGQLASLVVTTGGRMLLALKGWGLRTLLNLLQCPGYDLAPNVYRSELEKPCFNLQVCERPSGVGLAVITEALCATGSRPPHSPCVPSLTGQHLRSRNASPSPFPAVPLKGWGMARVWHPKSHTGG